eukprot:CAMPEP_0117471382 /NCGR_PEP_ID=MMETSP0784-20121206/7702_1 /TAXON_ID=39447 /ORGANISM="" /LENGTH=231 /DNA_ID=CAMNT_0005265499 /DNA_START=1 /DNA_END=696 /DNA_ORIENTATION=-
MLSAQLLQALVSYLAPLPRAGQYHPDSQAHRSLNARCDVEELLLDGLRCTTSLETYRPAAMQMSLLIRGKSHFMEEVILIFLEILQPRRCPQIVGANASVPHAAPAVAVGRHWHERAHLGGIGPTEQKGLMRGVLGDADRDTAIEELQCRINGKIGIGVLAFSASPLAIKASVDGQICNWIPPERLLLRFGARRDDPNPILGVPCELRVANLVLAIERRAVVLVVPYVVPM